MGLHDLKRSHYDCVWNLANEIATHLSGARNDTLFLSLRGTTVPKQSRRLPRPDKSGLAMTRGKGLAMTREVTAAVKNTGKTRYNS